MIKLTVNKQIKNPHYEIGLKAYNEGLRFHGNMGAIPYPKEEIVDSILEVMLTEEQYEDLKKAVVELW
jgi:hypothetical protein